MQVHSVEMLLLTENQGLTNTTTYLHVFAIQLAKRSDTEERC